MKERLPVISLEVARALILKWRTAAQVESEDPDGSAGWADAMRACAADLDEKIEVIS